MAERRMFAKTIIDSDAFIDMPLSTQALYFHLSMRADDDGFINNSKRIQRMIGASEDDLKLLFVKNFVIPFETGVVVIKHWKIHNYIRNDRYKETVYLEEKNQLETKENNGYTLKKNVGIPNGYQMDTQVRIEIGKSKDSKDKNSKVKDVDKEYFSNKELNDLFLDFLKMRKQLKAVNSERAINSLLNTLSKYDDDTKYKMIENSITNSWKGVFPLKQEKTYQSKPVRQEIVPDWLNKDIEEDTATPEEIAELEEYMKRDNKSFEERRAALQERLKEKYKKE